MNKYNIVSFGSAILDIFLISDGFKLIENGEGSVICQNYGEKIEVEKRVICSGGGGTNTAVSFSRFGLNSAVAARLGNDPFGKMIIAELEKEKVATGLLSVREEETDNSVVLLGPDGGRTILVCRGQTKLEIADVDWAALSAGWFYLTSLEGNLELVEKLINFVGEKQTGLAWNPGKLELADKDRVIRLASSAKVFNLNREEMEILLDQKMEEAGFWPSVERLAAEQVVVTDGRKGAYLLSRGQKPHFESTPAGSPVDETGAGDAFGSAFVYGLIKGMEPKDAFALAMKNGTSVVRYIGAKEGLLRSSDIF
ncbi:MAG: carbohydrate kinase family protein [Patescibacteria group bacterium]|nr:carbohydrate kinase family protein [Patescibacteria group bacterium]